MAKFKTRRLLGSALRVIGRSFEEAAQDLEEWADKIMRQVEGGIPGGFNNLAPATLQLNAAPSAGSESDGWTPPSHVHQLDLLLSARGDLLSHNGSVYVRVSQGTIPVGWVLTSDPSAPTGFVWRPPGSTSSISSSVENISDSSLRAAFDSLALRDLIARNYR